MLAEITSVSGVPADQATAAMQAKLAGWFPPSRFDSPRSVSLTAIALDDSTTDLGSLAWPPRGFPSATCDLTIHRWQTGSAITGLVHLPYLCTAVIGGMIVLPPIVMALSHTLIGIPVMAVGAVSYWLGRSQGGSNAVRDLARLLDLGT